MTNLYINNEKIDELSEKLLCILNNSNIDHNIIIMTKYNIKDAHIYCKINNIIGQCAGPLIQNDIINKYNMIKNNPSDTNGDCSLNKKFNYVQIRLNHNINYYLLTAYYLDKNNYKNKGELFLFLINKEKMKDIILNYGSYAHGTIREFGNITIESLNDISNNREYSIRPLYNDKCWNKLLESRIINVSI